MWAKATQIAGLFLVVCTSTHSVPTTHLPEAAGGYRFGWTVRDDETRDYKTHREEATGEGGGRGVQGEYTVGDPNGDLRVVSYSVAPGTGFRATVRVVPGGSPVGGSIIGDSRDATPSDKTEGTLAPIHLKDKRPSEGIPHVEQQPVISEQHHAIDNKPLQEPLEQHQTERSEQNHPDQKQDETPQFIHVEKPPEIYDNKHTNRQNISKQKDILNKPSVLVRIEQTQLEGSKQNNNERQSMRQQILNENKMQAASQSEIRPEQEIAEIKRPQNIATEELNENKTELVTEESQGKNQTRPKKTGNTSKREDLTTDSSLTQKPIDLLKDLPYIDKHIHNIEYIVEEGREDELQAKQNDFVTSDFLQGNQMIVKVHENEADKNHDLLELASETGDLNMSQGSSEGLYKNAGQIEKAVKNSAMRVDKKELNSTVNFVNETSINSTPDTRISSFDAGTGQSHTEPVIELIAQPSADKKPKDSDQTTKGSGEVKDDLKHIISNIDETKAHGPIDSLILAALMTSTSPVIKFTCLPDETVKNGLPTGPTMSIVPATNTQNSTHSHPEPPKAYVTTTFPILPFTMMNFGTTRFQPARPFLPQSSKSPQLGHVMNNYVTISSTNPQPTITAHVDKHMSFKARSNLRSDFSPAYFNGGLYPGYLLPPPWVRAQQHHGPRHMPIFVLPMSHNANFAPTFNPDMFGKHNQN